MYAILGDPIAQVASPILFNTAFRARGMGAVLVPMHVPPAALQGVIGTFRAVENFDGLVITVPHKVKAADWVDDLGPSARRIGAVNAIRKDPDGRLCGDNFDGVGFVRGFLAAGHTIAGRRVLIIGAGGAGRAVAHAVADARPQAIGIFDIDGRVCNGLVSAVAGFTSGGQVFAAEPKAEGFDVVVNCTSVGMHPADPLPVDVSGLSTRSVVADIILKPSITPLLHVAMQRGCAIHEGLRMLEAQTDALIDFFRAGSGSDGA